MKVALLVPDPAVTRLIEVDVQPCSIPGWPEIPAVVRRPVNFSSDPAEIEKEGWIVSCAECGLAFMKGQRGATRHEAIEIATDNFNSTAERMGRTRMIEAYIHERDTMLTKIKSLRGAGEHTLPVEQMPAEHARLAV